jgi:hypothetical protein
MTSAGFNCKLRLDREFVYTFVQNLSQFTDVKAINTSWRVGNLMNLSQLTIQNAIADEVYAKGIVWVAAAGNGPLQSNPSHQTRPESYMIPASLNNVISVTSVGCWDPSPGGWAMKDHHYLNYSAWPTVNLPSGNVPATHQHNDRVDIAAPGYGVLMPGNKTNGSYDYPKWDGTSFAAPLVSGVVGLIFSVNPTLNPDEVECIIKSTAVDIYNVGQNSQFIGKLGAGRIDAYEAVKKAKDMVLPPSIPSGETYIWNTCKHPKLLSNLDIEPFATLLVKSGASLYIPAGVTLTIKENANFILENGAYLCVDPSANIILVDPSSTIDIPQSTILQTHPKWDITLHPSIALPPWDLSGVNNCISLCDIQKIIVNNGASWHFMDTYLITAGSDKEFCGEMDSHELGSTNNPQTGHYQWTPQNFLDDPNSPHPVAAPVSQTITYSLMYEDVSGCKDTDNVTLTVHPMPNASIQVVGNRCTNFNFSLSGVNPGLISGYNWSFGTGSGPISSTTANPQGITYSTNGIKSVQVQITMTSGCVFSYQLALKVVDCCTQVNTLFAPNSNSWVGTNTPWGGTLTGGGTGAPGTILGVDGTVTLTNGVYHFDQSTIVFTGDYNPVSLDITKSRIVVAEDATLILDNCLLTADCNVMWYGIQVIRNGRVEMINNTTLEHSFVGIEPLGTNANIYIENSFFFNNLKSSIRFSEFQGYNGGPVDILGNYFSCNSSQWLAPYNNSSDVYSNTYLYFEGANLDPVIIRENVFEESANQIISKNDAMLRIEGNTFNNYRTQGLYALGQGQLIMATSNTFNSYPSTFYFHNSPDFDQVNTFPVHVYNIGSYPPTVGIHLIGNNFTIENNQFLGNWGAVNAQRHAIGILGRLVGNQTALRSNYCNRLSYGVVLSEAQNMGVLVNGNKFENNRAAGVLVYDNGTTVTNSNIEISCNDFVRVLPFNADVRSGIIIRPNAFLNSQGTCQVGFTPAKPAGNEFLPMGYPLSYNANGTANFPPGYWSGSSTFTSIENFGAPLVYSQYLNEYVHEPMIAPVGLVSLVTCTDPSQPNTPPLVGDASVCPTPVGSGVANRSISVNTHLNKDSKNPATEEGLRIIPNPAKDRVQLRLNNVDLTFIEVELSDIIGKRMSITLKTNEQGELDISALRSGVYLVVVTGSEFHSIGKLIVQP